MKKVTLSLVAISLLSSASFADITFKGVGGDAKLFYRAVNKGGQDFAEKTNNAGDAAISLKGVLGVGNGATINWGVTGVSTLGLDGALVGQTWVTHTEKYQKLIATNDINASETISTNDKNDLADVVWLDTLNLTFRTIANTTMIIGRQQLDTPMVFSEHWNIVPNTYDAIVVANKYFANTTLVGAWVGRSNVNGGNTVHVYKSDQSFTDFVTGDGAYAFGAVNKSFCNTTLQGWYFNVPHITKVAWLQLDSKYMGIDYGLQYAANNPNADGVDTLSAFGAKIGGNLYGVNLTAAYSTVSDDNNVTNFVNVGGGQSKLYTDAWWNMGVVAQPNTDAYTLTANYDFGIVNATLSYTNAKQDKSNKVGAVIPNKTELKETALILDKSLGALDVSLALVNAQTQVNDVDQASDNEIQAYFTYHF